MIGDHICDAWYVNCDVRRETTVCHVERVSTIINYLKSIDHNGFPVTKDDGKTFCGLILRNTLLRLLERGVYFK